MKNQTTAGANSGVLVVGGAGYIGSVLVQRLLKEGYRVRVLDSLIWGNASSLVSISEHPRFEFVKADMRDSESVNFSLDGMSSVILLAGLVGDPITKAYPRESADVNRRGVTTVIEAALEHGVDRLVFASTCSNYGLKSDEELATEESSLSPLSLYAEQKVAVEELLMTKMKSSFSAITILRFATAYGVSPRMRLDLTISHFAKDAVLDGRIEIYDADTWRPYCHVQDLSTAILNVLSAQLPLIRGEVFNVGSTQENFTKRRIGELIKERRNETELIYREGGADTRNYKVSFEKISRVLGFECQFGLRAYMPLILSSMHHGIVPVQSGTPSQLGNYTIQKTNIRVSDSV